MEYNSERDHLVIPEYGRNIQKMIQFACAVNDRQERNKVAEAIVDVMGNLNPHFRDVNDFKGKLWTHLFKISRGKLEIDAPYPKPDSIEEEKVSKRLPYPSQKIRYKHYGKAVEFMISAAREMEEGDERTALVQTIANLMKKCYLNWNRDSVNDQMIIDQLYELSEGELKPPDGFELTSTNDILGARSNARSNVRSGASGKRQNQGRSNRGRSNNRSGNSGGRHNKRYSN